MPFSTKLGSLGTARRPGPSYDVSSDLSTARFRETPPLQVPASENPETRTTVHAHRVKAARRPVRQPQPSKPMTQRVVVGCTRNIFLAPPRHRPAGRINRPRHCQARPRSRSIREALAVRDNLTGCNPSGNGKCNNHVSPHSRHKGAWMRPGMPRPEPASLAARLIDYCRQASNGPSLSPDRTPPIRRADYLDPRAGKRNRQCSENTRQRRLRLRQAWPMPARPLPIEQRRHDPLVQSAHSGSVVKAMVSQRSGLSSPISSPISSRIRSQSSSLLGGRFFGTMKQSSICLPRPTLAT